MANKDLFKQAIAEAKSVREAAIANAKEALEETLTPHLKDMLAAKLQEMEDKDIEEEVVNEVEEEAVEENSGFIPVTAEAEEEEAEDDSEESEDEAEEEGEDEAGEETGEEEAEIEGEEAVEGDEEIGNITVDQFKDMIRDIVAQEIGGGEEDMGMDMDAGDIEGMGDEAPIEEPADDMEVPAEDEEEIDLDELIRELELAGSEPVAEGSHEDEEKMDEEVVEEDTSVQVPADAESKEDKAKNINRTVKEDLQEALETIEQLNKDLLETNLLNSKLLYVNKIFKANDLSESQKVNIIAAFDKAETVKEVKLVFETVSENVVATKKGNVTESKIKGMASKATGTTASKPEVISEVSDAVLRMQKLAGIIK